MNKFELKRHNVALIREQLRTTPACTADLADQFGVSSSAILTYLKDAATGDEKAFVSDYFLKNGVWVAIYSFGVGEDKPKPKEDKKARDRRSNERLRQDPERLEARRARRRERYAGMVATRLPGRVKKVLTPEEAETRAEQIREQRERHEREQRAAQIKPHRDDYAWFMFGGLPAGVRHVY